MQPWASVLNEVLWMTAAGFTQLYLLKLCLVIVQITWIQFTKANIYINNSKNKWSSLLHLLCILY